VVQNSKLMCISTKSTLSIKLCVILEVTIAFRCGWVLENWKTYSIHILYLNFDIEAPLMPAVFLLLPLSTTYGVLVSFCFCCNMVSVQSGVSVELMVFISCVCRRSQLISSR